MTYSFILTLHVRFFHNLPFIQDTDETGFCYGSSVPMDQLVDPLGDCIFAYEMNGE